MYSIQNIIPPYRYIVSQTMIPQLHRYVAKAISNSGHGALCAPSASEASAHIPEVLAPTGHLVVINLHLASEILRVTIFA